MFKQNQKDASYSVICDKCGKSLNFGGFLTKNQANCTAMIGRWLTVEKFINEGKLEHYCPDCYQYGLSQHPEHRILGLHVIKIGK